MIKTNPAGGNGGAGPRPRAGVNCLRVYHTPKPGGGQFLWYAGRRVASVDPDLVLRRTLHSSKHLYRGTGEEAWSFHAAVIAEARRLGAAEIEVKDADSGMIYSVDFDVFLHQARPFVNEWGPQLALPLREWNVIDMSIAMQLAMF